MERSYRKFRQALDPETRAANIHPDTRSLTVPDVVPSLKEIILSGSAQRVGALLYDDSEDAGYQRLFAQSAPLEVILKAQFEGFPEDEENDKRSAKADEEAGAGKTEPETVGEK